MKKKIHSDCSCNRLVLDSELIDFHLLKKISAKVIADLVNITILYV